MSDPTYRKVSLLVALFAVGAAFAAVAPATVASGVVVHTYDEFSGNGNKVGGSYPGFLYGEDDQVWCSYNSDGYPATTPPCVVIPVSTGAFTITALASRITQYEADVSSSGYVVTFTGYDDAGFLVATTSCSAGYGTSIHCVLTSTTPMKTVRVSGPADYYILDTSVFTLHAASGTTVPGVTVGHSVPSQSTPSSTPAQCDPTATVCVDPIPLPGPVVTPGVSVSAGTTDIVVTPGTETIPPTTVGPVKICQDPPSQVCQSKPTVSVTGSATVSVTVGATTISKTVP